MPAAEEAAQQMVFPLSWFEKVAQPSPLREQMPRMRPLGGGSPWRPRASHRIQGTVQEMDLLVPSAQEEAQ